ncbi:DUF4440 domain-containing protein [Aurantimonas sp. VKM B-3413]|uniref:DUF4440 domain-containing protein n=1 Tax=Aurantimonas sp. VKM B-3413 TaxID=2779401 RepID=UPI001E3C2878|nr:DUF4440 domain-containing protein [Aurantimonas sp. VKM B-3413]MCB8840651.1 DUF4440 domain-containing protein [Aurantimonas sp. VKM B-3413]
MGDEAIWAAERALWIEGADRFRETLAPDCVMAFAEPVGILQGRETIIATLEQAPRWRSVEMTDTRTAVTGPVVVLAYRALAQRDGSPDYRALCSSTYSREPAGLCLLQHQQTPLT